MFRQARIFFALAIPVAFAWGSTARADAFVVGTTLATCPPACGSTIYILPGQFLAQSLVLTHAVRCTRHRYSLCDKGADEIKINLTEPLRYSEKYYEE